MNVRRLFSSEGRLTRKDFWRSLLITVALFWAGVLIPGQISFVAEKQGIDSGFLHYLPGVIFYAQAFVLLWYMRGVVIRRRRDMNSSGYLFHLLWFIPGFGWLAAIMYLGSKPSQPKTEAEVYPDELEASESDSADEMNAR